MGKEAVTITIDSHLHQWIKEKGGNKSRVVNTLLHECWIRQRDNQQKLPKKVEKMNQMIHPKTKDIVEVGPTSIQTEILFSEAGYIMHKYGSDEE